MMIPKAADHSSEIRSTDPSMTDTDPQSGAPKITLKPSSSTTWSRFKDPRVVRVSKALGGKDRHSKVCTVRGLRDRRVRLSVPTAIQLYDLQERLGLNQPSKVVDWLLDAAKHEIDELPPLEIPPEMMMTMMGSSTSDQNTTNFHQILNFHEFGQARRGLKVSEKSSGEEMRLGDGERNDWCSRNAQDETRQFHDLENATTNNNGTYNSIFRLDASGLTLSQASRVGQHDENWHNFGLLPLQVSNLTNSLPSGVLVYHQPGVMSTQPYFPSGIGATSGDFHDPKEVNYHGSQIPAVDSAGQTSVRSLHFNMTANLLPSNDGK